MGRILLILSGGLVALSGCLYQSRTLPQPTDAHVDLQMQRAGDQLSYCDAGGTCYSLPNPRDCSTLTARVDTANAKVCETCTDSTGAVQSSTCHHTEITCSLVTAPDPDCVVCAAPDGEVVYTSCQQQELNNCVYYANGSPVPAAGTSGAPTTSCNSDADCGSGMTCATTGSAAGECVPDCQICYDAGGRAVLTQCPNDCSNVVCPSLQCASGYEATREPGACCDRCVPVATCNANVCPMASSVPTCPDGTELERDPSDCCHYQCIATRCPTDTPTTPDQPCPTGYAWDSTFPNCGRCVLQSGAKVCATSGDCGTDEYCTTETGTCMQGGGSAGSSTDTSTCYGVCSPITPNCDSTTGMPLTSSVCDGQWESQGTDAFGCPLPPVCVCPDNVVSIDGTCPDQCAGVECPTPAPTCPTGDELVTTYPYCCGACVPTSDVCTTSSGSTTSSSSGSSSTGTAYACPDIQCPNGYHTEPGPDCCNVCVRDTQSCQQDTDCAADEHCNLDTMTCAPNDTCTDSDGIDPNTAGTVTGTRSGTAYTLQDTCATSDTLIEYWCYAEASGSSSMVAGKLSVNCPNGCANGACVSSP